LKPRSCGGGILPEGAWQPRSRADGQPIAVLS
jgi:hypothetical protein